MKLFRWYARIILLFYWLYIW